MKMEIGVSIVIPESAKKNAKEGLDELNNVRFTPQEARNMGVYSGVSWANKIIKNKSLNRSEIRSIALFYMRCKDKSDIKTETAMKLWGGRELGELLYNISN